MASCRRLIRRLIVHAHGQSDQVNLGQRHVTNPAIELQAHKSEPIDKEDGGLEGVIISDMVDVASNEVACKTAGHLVNC